MGDDARLVMLMREVYEPGNPARRTAASALIRALRQRRNLAAESERIAREVGLTAGEAGVREVRRLCDLVA
ncbi:hypothetical protein [Afifella sp. IM 167]|uniref:hypothetical protein n=1 Tax=Afifella sp. IM 167 TaxID=2033586 RepID=UPI001CCFD875|nr:hypothetical protein [Afifella sp. IM 167]MBZ8132763.1 hypothetical protein [Afifella sp. IM 167]